MLVGIFSKFYLFKLNVFVILKRRRVIRLVVRFKNLKGYYFFVLYTIF